MSDVPGLSLVPDAIYDQGTTADYMARHPDALAALPGEPQPFQFNDSERWSATSTDGSGLAQGDPTTLTWSIVPDGTSIFGFIGEGPSDSDLISFLGGIYGVTSNDAILMDEPWFPLFQDFFDRWSAVSGMSYVYEPNDDGDAWTSTRIAAGQLGVRGDVRISGHFIDGESGRNVLAYNFFPNRGDMVIDTGNPAFFGNTAGNSVRLRNVLAHEQGHGLGLRHVCPVIGGEDGRLMEPFINVNFDGPQFDDILAVQRGYGDALEKSGGNDTSATATDLGLLLAGQMIERGTQAEDNRISPTDTELISIDDNSDVDFFKFTIGSSLLLSATLTPQGPEYLSGPQNGDGSCSEGTTFTAASQNDLTLELLSSDGTTVLTTSNTAGLGGAESINDIMLPAGTYFTRITGVDNAAQLYELSLVSGLEPGVVVAPSDGNTRPSESGDTDTYTLGLTSVPAGPVQLKVTADTQTQVSFNGSDFANSLVLTLSDPTPQTVTVRAIDDAIDEGLHTGTISHAITSTGDPGSYPTSLAIEELTATIADNDPPAQASNQVIAFSSQWSPSNYSAAQTLGPANVFAYGDNAKAWSASVADGTIEQLTLGFSNLVFANGVTVRESWGNGFVRAVEVRSASDGTFANVFSGEDPSAPGSVVDFVVPFPQTAFLVDGIRITIDTDQSTVWEEIDSVQLHGVAPASAGITVTPTAGLTTTEDGGTATVTVVLDSVPSADVTIGLSSSDPTEGTVSPASLTFTPGTALTPQSVTITGVNDLLVDGDIAYTIATAAAASNDPKYHGIDADDVSVVNQDSEGGTLLSQQADGVIAFSSQWTPSIYSAAQALGPADVFAYGDNPNAWAASVANGTLESLTLGFVTPVFATGVTIRESWGNGFVRRVELRNTASGEFVEMFSGTDTSVPGTVVDFLVRFSQTAFLVDAVRITTDTSHSSVWEEIDAVQLHGAAPPPAAGITVAPPAGLLTTESGDTASFSLVLGTVPTADVTVGLKSSDLTEGTISPSSVTFTPANALTPQTVTLSGVDDSIDDGDVGYTIVTAAAISADPNYGGFDPDDVQAVNGDNDGPLPISQTASSVIAFSSQWSPTNYSAAQVLGGADVFTYGDSPQAWSASVRDGTTEQLTLGFTVPILANAVTVRETWGNGFITNVEVRDAFNGALVSVFSGVDPSDPGSVVDFVVSFTQTVFLVDAVRITIDTDHSAVWEEIDSVLLHGVSPPRFTERETGPATSQLLLHDVAMRGFSTGRIEQMGGPAVGQIGIDKGAGPLEIETVIATNAWERKQRDERFLPRENRRTNSKALDLLLDNEINREKTLLLLDDELLTRLAEVQ